ncbi:MAG: nucleoside deaminase [Gammaproteobacteria bacterium]
MKRLITWMMIIAASFFVAKLAIAAQDSFCDTYDSKITHMNAFKGNSEIYSGLPKKLTATEFKTLPKTWDGYCPPCVLKNKSQCEARPCQKYNLMQGNIYQGIQAKNDPWMKMANEEGLKSVQNGGGPFGVVILQIDDNSKKIIRYWVNHNHVTEWSDPTAHAEITTIRAASRELGVLDLGHINKNESKLSQPSEWSHCVLYSSVESCPMCLSAIYWAGIKQVAFAATRYDADANGVNFSDKMIYEELARSYAKREHMEVVHSNTDNSLDAFNYYKRQNVARYGVAD